MQNARTLFSIAAVLALGSLGFCGCAATGEASSDATVELTPPLILIADGQTRTVASGEAETIEEALERADIQLQDGDVLSVRTDYALSSCLVVEVLRPYTVHITCATDDLDGNYTVRLLGATVADALQALGIVLSDSLSCNYAPDDALVDGMQIEVFRAAEPEEPDSEGWSDTGGSNDSGWSAASANGGDTPAPGTTGETQTQSGTGDTGESSDSSDDGAGDAGQASGDEASARTVVSSERYDDCDGSGHGVEVITYSDGSQEEREY